MRQANSQSAQSLSVFKVVSLGVLALSFYSNIRIGPLTVFDVVGALYCAVVLPHTVVVRKAITLLPDPLLLAAAAVFLLAVLGSGSVAYDGSGHFQRCGLLLGGLLLMMVFSQLVVAFGRIGLAEIQQTIVLSSAITSIVCIAQGKLGLFMGLLQSEKLEFWTRPSGLVEHPVEAGLVAAYGALFAVSLILDGRRVILNALCAGLILYSMTIIASLTGVAAALLGIGILLFVRKGFSVFLLVPIVGLIGIILFLYADSFSGTFFAERLTQLSESGLQYETLSSRATQIDDTINTILSGGVNIILGFGYDPELQIDAREIHNGLLASQYHFGLLGAVSQLCFLGCFFHKAANMKSPAAKIVCLLAFMMFLAFYMSGPAFFRRSVWLPMFLITAVSTSKQETERLLSWRDPFRYAHT